MYHHARFWQYTGNHQFGCDCHRYNPHNYELSTMSALAWLLGNGETNACGVSLDGADVRYGAGDSFGRVVRLKATPEQWGAAKQWASNLKEEQGE